MVAAPFVERRPFRGPGQKPCAKIRVCSGCYLAGWRLEGEPIERRAWREREPQQQHVLHEKESEMAAPSRRSGGLTL